MNPLISEKTPVYLDNAATTQPDPAVVEAMRLSLTEGWGNPSSAHAVGSRARMSLDNSRASIAALLQCHDDEVFFTSGGTEADNWALLGSLDHLRGQKDHLITLDTEHHAVLDTAHYWEKRGGAVTILAVNHDGRVDPDDLAKAIQERTAIVSVMHVNNELGTIQDIPALGAICRERGVLFHVDCVQSYGKLPFVLNDLNADMVSISSHKIHGPKGIGALVIRRGVRISPRSIGGSQERKLRTGTENMPGIIGFGTAAEICKAQLTRDAAHVQKLRDRLEQEILDRIDDVHINGSRDHRAPSLLNVAFPGCEGEALLVALDRKGFCVSTGSACSAGALGASHVLMGIGLDVQTAQSSLRFSFGRFNTMNDVDKLMEILPGVVSRQRELAAPSVRRVP